MKSKKNIKLKNKIVVIFLLLLLLILSYYLAGKNPQNKLVKNYKESTIEEYLINSEKEIITLDQGEHFFKENIQIKENQILVIEPGARLKMAENIQIIVDGRIIAIGTEENPVIFEAEDKYWRGIRINGIGKIPDSENFYNWLKRGDGEKENIFIENIKKGNIFKNCEFNNISTESREFSMANKWKASIEAYDTSIWVNNSKFDDVLYIGGILGQRSYVLINNNDISSDLMHKNVNCTDHCVIIAANNILKQKREENQRCADGIWINQSVGLAYGNKLFNIGDDGIDSDNSKLILIDNEINNTFDDGIDIDSKGESYLINNSVNDSKDNAILISSNSRSVLVDNIIKNSKTGLFLRDGSGAAIDNLKITDNKIGILLSQNIPCLLAENDYKKIKNELSIFTDEEIKKEGINNISSTKEAIAVLENNYNKEGEIYYFNKDMFIKNVQEIMKLVNILNLENVESDKVENNKFCSSLKNSLYLTSSKVVDNGIDILPLFEYQMKVEDTEFSTNQGTEEVQKLCEKDFECELIDKLNISSVISNSKRIIKNLESL